MADEEATWVDREVLVATLGQAERMLEVQRQESEILQKRAESMIRLAVAAFAGTMAALGLILNARIPVGWAGFVGFASGSLTILFGLAWFVLVHIGYPRPDVQAVGPDLALLIDRMGQMIDRMGQNDWNIDAYRMALLDSFRVAYDQQSSTHDVLSRKVSSGVVWMFLRTGILLTTLAYILGGAIHV